MQYGELNFIWEAWLDFDMSWHDEEIIVNEVRGRSIADWEARTKKVIGECFRVLKPGRWLSLCYHDTSEGTWTMVQDKMAEVGFVIDKSESTLFIDTQQKTYNQKTADKTTKRDLVLNFRKPKVGEFVVTRPVDGRTFVELGTQVIRARARAVDGWAKENGFTVLFCSGNLALREMYENLRDDPTAKLILVDRTRDRAKLPLFYPDLEARCKSKARLTITLREFLTERTGDQRYRQDPKAQRGRVDLQPRPVSPPWHHAQTTARTVLAGPLHARWAQHG